MWSELHSYIIFSKSRLWHDWIHVLPRKYTACIICGLQTSMSLVMSNQSYHLDRCYDVWEFLRKAKVFSLYLYVITEFDRVMMQSWTWGATYWKQYLQCQKHNQNRKIYVFLKQFCCNFMIVKLFCYNTISIFYAQ